MRLRFLLEADEEFREAARFYEGRAQGLGAAFIAEVRRCAAMLVTFPELGARLDQTLGLRKFGLRRFPYSLIYAASDEEIVIAALAHQKRRPYYWNKRL